MSGAASPGSSDPLPALTSLAFVDVHGRLRGKAYTRDAFAAICRRGYAGCTDLLLAVDVADEPITALNGLGARGGAPDLRLVPDLATLVQLPWQPSMSLCLGDLAWADGSPCELASRAVLAAALRSVADRGLTVKAAFEYELRLHDATDGRPSTPGLSYSVEGIERIGTFAAMLRECCEPLGVRFEACHTESGAGLVEVNCAAENGMRAADTAVLLRHAVRQVASSCGLRASFLAKAHADQEGSSGHIHLSLWDGKTNALAAGPGGLNDLMNHSVAGVVGHMSASSLVLNPTINSFKRLVPGFFAPINASWGLDNRSCAVRVILDGSATRIEVRRSGADANPYLALAAVVASLRLGLEEQAPPPPPVEGDAYVVDQESARALPASLESAVQAFDADADFRDALGREFSDYYATTQRWELAAFQRSVTGWELERYDPNP